MPVSSKALTLLPANEVNCAGDEPRCVCIIHDYSESSRKHVQTLPSSTTLDQLFEEVAKKLHLLKGTFEMTFSKDKPQPGGKNNTKLDIGSFKTLAEAGFQEGRNFIYVNGIDGVKPKSSQVTTIAEDMSDDGTSSTEWTYSSSVPKPPPVPPKTSLPSKNNLRRNAFSDTSGCSFSESISRRANEIKGEEFKGVDEKEPHLRGLVNQAMTCYLNSLIQTLYMTPEFRNAIYMWEFKGTDEKAVTTIPFQLQRLFLALQTSDKQAVETTDLTKSFGWDSSEAWQQHDIQELCRVMFDALEQTEQAEIIKLYEGKMKDYVQCSECKNESARTDTYLDIPITIRPFGSTVTYKTVMEGLRAFVEPETLDGCNQYFCEKCDKKCDAKKGLKFITFPYLLTLQLKRFDFDYSTMHRVKLNDRMFFPQELDLNLFIEDEIIKDSVSEPGSDCVDEVVGAEDGLDMVGALQIEEEEGDHSSRDSGNDDDRPYSGDRSRKNPVHRNSDDSEEGSSVDEGIDIESQKSYRHTIVGSAGSVGARAEEDGLDSGTSTPGATGGAPKKEDWESLHGTVQENDTEKVKGPYIYELFSVMIHSGSAVGGHYYAYIKSFDDDQWYSFNDQVVSPISLEDIEKSYGGSAGRSSYHSSFSSSTNAYMLMYRQRDSSRNKDFIRTENLPEHIKELAVREKENELKIKENKEKEKNMCSIKVYCQHPALLGNTNQTSVDESYEFHNKTTLREATDEVYKLFKLDDAGAKRENCRLIKYDSYHQSLDQSLDDEEKNQDESLADLLGGARLSYLFDLLMETREDGDEPFQIYKVGGITVKAYAADYETGCFRDPVVIRMMQTDSVYHMKQVIAKRLRYPLPRIRMAYEKYTCDVQLLTTAKKTLKDIGLFRSVKIFFDVMNDEEYEKLKEHSNNEYMTDSYRTFIKETRLWKLVDRASNLINISLILPEDAPTYELTQLHPVSPPSFEPPPDSPPSVITSQPNPLENPKLKPKIGSSPPPDPQGSTPSSDEGLGSYDGSSGNNTDTQEVDSSPTDPTLKREVVGAEAPQTTDCNTDEITLFWRSPERESCDGVDEYAKLDEGTLYIDEGETNPSTGGPDEAPLPSSSLHLRRNSEENMDWTPGSPGYCPLSAGDLQAALDQKFLGTGYNPTSPTSSLKCEDGSSSDGESETSGEFDFAATEERQQGDGATDSAGSCSTIDSTDTLCNTDTVDTSHTKTDDSVPLLLYPYSGDQPHKSGLYSYLPSVPTATKSCALPGMARRVTDIRTDCPGTEELEMTEFACNDGRVDKAFDPLDSGTDHCGLCQCSEKASQTVEGSLNSATLDTGPGYQCSQCGKLKPQCVFACEFESRNEPDPLSNPSPSQDPESGEGLDNITPLFADSDSEEKGAGDSAPDGKPKYDFSSFNHADDEPGTSRQRTESSSSVLSDLGWGDQLQQHHSYFRVIAVHTNNQKCQVLRAKLDKRSPVGWLKRQIQPIIQVPTRQFSIYRIYHGGQENELNSLNETFSLVPDDTRFRVKHERALRKNEHRCKVFNLMPTEDDPVKHLVDWVVRKGLSIEDARRLVCEELAKQCDMKMEPEKIRLRKKCWRSPGKIFMKSEKFGTEIQISYNLEIFLEILDKPERKTKPKQLALYCRRWRPSTLTLDPFQEVVLEPDSHGSHTVKELKNTLAEICDIDATDIEWTKPHGIFPCHMSVLEVQQLDWEPMFTEYLHTSPACISEDGSVIFYRNKKEELRELSDKERSELQVKEAARLVTAKSSTSTSSSSSKSGTSFRPYSRKEKALKIYTVDTISKKKEATTSL